MLRNAAYEQCQGGAVLLDLLHQGWNRRAHDGGQTRLLGDIECGCGAIAESVLDQLQDSFTGYQILLGDTQEVLSLEYEKIGISDAHQGGERYDLAIKTASRGGR